MAAQKTITDKLGQDFNNIRSYVKQNPGCELEQLTVETGLHRNTILQLLNGMKTDNDVCDGKSFKINYQAKCLTVDLLEQMLAELKQGKGDHTKLAERLLYLYHCLHSALPDGGLTFDQLIKHYEGLGGNSKKPEAIKKMIFRDLRQLEDMHIGMVRPSQDSKRYCLKEVYLPKLGPESAAAIYVGMQLFHGTVLDQATDLAREQISKAFLKRSFHDAAALSGRFLVTEDTLADPEKFGDKFGKLSKSVIDSYRIKIEYIKLNGEISTRVVEPLGMLCKRGVWYLVAKDVKLEDYRTFRVDQIEEVYPREDEKFDYPKGFSLDKHLGDSWGVFADDEVQDVVLNFTPHVARRIKNLNYHRSQEIFDEADGSVTVKFKVCGLIEIKSWILQWGEQVEVVEPSWLRDDIKKIALGIAGKY